MAQERSLSVALPSDKIWDSATSNPSLTDPSSHLRRCISSPSSPP
ncbi:hypothetical protein ACP70R_014659 [Stipagrostis hirtigluma subsp. patula]